MTVAVSNYDLQKWYNKNHLNHDDCFYYRYDDITYLLCDILTPSEKARAKACIKKGGFFTFGYNGLHCCSNKENANRFFKKFLGVEFRGLNNPPKLLIEL